MAAGVVAAGSRTKPRSTLQLPAARARIEREPRSAPGTSLRKPRRKRRQADAIQMTSRRRATRSTLPAAAPQGLARAGARKKVCPLRQCRATTVRAGARDRPSASVGCPRLAHSTAVALSVNGAKIRHRQSVEASTPRKENRGKRDAVADYIVVDSTGSAWLNLVNVNAVKNVMMRGSSGAS